MNGNVFGSFVSVHYITRVCSSRVCVKWYSTVYYYVTMQVELKRCDDYNIDDAMQGMERRFRIKFSVMLILTV